MSTNIKEAGKTASALSLATLLLFVWVAKKLIFVAFIVGLALPLLPEQTVQAFLRLPLVSHSSPLFLWLTQHGLHLCLVLTFLMVFSLLKKVDRLQSYQNKQAYILGGLMSYLEISDFRFSYAVEEAKKSGVSFDGVLSQWFRNAFGRLVGGEFIAGTDPFDTALKRGDNTVTLKADIKRYLQETEPREAL